jgi:preprotein translocase subunit SecA
LYQKDIDYCVDQGQIVLVDTFTGRLLQGRRLTDGLHQAIESREGVSISPETHLIATVSTQNYFRLYDKLAGMTGTAVTSAHEFKEIYKLDVVQIPTNKPLQRMDERDVFLRTEREKMEVVLGTIHQAHSTGRPILVGTVSIEKSENLSMRLKKLNIPHQVLNARYHRKEADIISKAGRVGAVTIATNMAGRGTDIKLGSEAKEGLYVIGTERHESRRIDHQLRGRAGRQGDPGSSKFFNSLEDELLKKFGTGKLVKAMKVLTMPMLKGMAQSLLERLVDFAQSTVEFRNFNLRKTLLEFDNVIDSQRRILYAFRHQILTEQDTSAVVLDFLSRLNSERNWQELYASAKTSLGEGFHVVERLALLGIIDKYWVQHLSDMERLRDGIGFRSFAQTNLITEFKRESYRFFSTMMDEMAKTLEKALLQE